MKKIVILASTLAAAMPAFAQDPAAVPPTDPNQIICVTVQEIGSRLGRTRRCATRAQWDEDRRQQRIAAERGQMTQINPQDMNAAERARAQGRYVGGLGPPPISPR